MLEVGGKPDDACDTGEIVPYIGDEVDVGRLEPPLEELSNDSKVSDRADAEDKSLESSEADGTLAAELVKST